MCISESKSPKSLQYSCTGSKWAPEVTADLRTLEAGEKKKTKKLLNAHSGIQRASLLYLPSYQTKPHAPVTMRLTVLNTSTFCTPLCLFMYCSLYPNYSFFSLTDEMVLNHTLILQGTAQMSPPLHSTLSNRIILPSCVFPQHFC